LVLTIATMMMTINGSAAKRLNSPQTSSTQPKNGPMSSGTGMPFLANRPAPRTSG